MSCRQSSHLTAWALLTSKHFNNHLSLFRKHLSKFLQISLIRQFFKSNNFSKFQTGGKKLKSYKIRTPNLMAEYLDFEPTTSFPDPGPKTAHLVLYPVLISEDVWPFSGLTHSLFVKSLDPCPKRNPTPGFEMDCVALSSLRAHTQGCGLRVMDTDPAWPPHSSAEV